MPQTTKRKKEYTKERYWADREAALLRVKRFREENPDYQRAYDLNRKYGITIEEYDTLLDIQGGVCAICSRKCSSGRRLAVDHDSITGKIRGLLCTRCNRGLGNFDHDSKFLEGAANYLRQYANG